MIELIEILLGACIPFVPEEYQKYVFAIAPPIFLLVILIFTFWLVGWFAKTLYNALTGGRDK